MGEARRILARYQAPSENLAETRSPPFGTKFGGAATGDWWCMEKSRMSFSKEAMPVEYVNDGDVFGIVHEAHPLYLEFALRMQIHFGCEHH
jgi:hypothetical protein